MRYEQDVAPPRTEAWWTPAILKETISDLVARNGMDRLLYTVIDEADSATETWVAYMWPEVTEVGSLLFRRAFKPGRVDRDSDPPEPGGAAWLNFTVKNPPNAEERDEDLRSLVERFRRQFHGLYLLHRGTPPPKRPLRVGDTFVLVVATEIRPDLSQTTGKWSSAITQDRISTLIDVTFEAREVTRAAMFAALAPPMSADEAPPPRAEQTGSPAAGPTDSGDSSHRANPTV